VIDDGARPTVKKIVAIPAIEDILALLSAILLASEHIVLSVAPVEHIIARVAVQEVSARPPVEHVLARVGVVRIKARIPAPALHLVVTRGAVDAYVARREREAAQVRE
jgi:hypothetical protein